MRTEQQRSKAEEVIRSAATAAPATSARPTERAVPIASSLGRPADESRDARRRQFEMEALVHLDALYSFALKLTRSRDEAEDLVSDTILRAFDRWEQYELGTNVRA